MVVENQLISTATPMIKLLSLRGFFNPTRITINNYSRREINAFYYIFPERDKLFNSRRDCYKSNNFWETKIISLICVFGCYLKFKDNIVSQWIQFKCITGRRDSEYYYKIYNSAIGVNIFSRRYFQITPIDTVQLSR